MTESIHPHVKTDDLLDDVRPVRAESILVSVKSVWGMFLAIGVIAIFILRMSFQVDALREEMSRVNMRLVELDRVTEFKSQLMSLKENGSDAVKVLTMELARMRHDFDVHVAETREPNSKIK